ncbi:hypothetical protein [Kitasatospora albolonga]|uniref:hypothetical protein n=1 Tax=Kitasatospora albolonga TaxID=68173 RepID=UPI0031F0893C
MQQQHQQGGQQRGHRDRDVGAVLELEGVPERLGAAVGDRQALPGGLVDQHVGEEQQVGGGDAERDDPHHGLLEPDLARPAVGHPAGRVDEGEGQQQEPERGGPGA